MLWAVGIIVWFRARIYHHISIKRLREECHRGLQHASPSPNQARGRLVCSTDSVEFLHQCACRRATWKICVSWREEGVDSEICDWQPLHDRLRYLCQKDDARNREKHCWSGVEGMGTAGVYNDDRQRSSRCFSPVDGSGAEILRLQVLHHVRSSVRHLAGREGWLGDHSETTWQTRVVWSRTDWVLRFVETGSLPFRPKFRRSNIKGSNWLLATNRPSRRRRERSILLLRLDHSLLLLGQRRQALATESSSPSQGKRGCTVEEFRVP